MALLGRLWGGDVIAAARGGLDPRLLILLFAIVVILLITQRKAVAKVVAPGRHSWTPDEQLATIKFYDAHHAKEPQEYEEALLKLSKELAIKPSAVRAAVQAVGMLEGKASGRKPSKQLQRVWEQYRGKKA